MLSVAALVVLLAVLSANAAGLRELTPADIQEVDRLLERMSEAEKLGQMFMVGFLGTKPSRGVVELIQRCNIGGVILYKVNLEDQRGADQQPARVLESVARLTNALQDSIPRRTGSALPLLIAADQEGGASVIVDTAVQIDGGPVGGAHDFRGYWTRSGLGQDEVPGFCCPDYSRLSSGCEASSTVGGPVNG
jgi:hypothetical protein